MNRYLVVTGGTVSKKVLETVLSDYDFQKIIACDKGLEICQECDILPDLVIGDFDSAKTDIVASYRGKTEFLDLDTHKILQIPMLRFLIYWSRRSDRMK